MTDFAGINLSDVKIAEHGEDYLLTGRFDIPKMNVHGDISVPFSKHAVFVKADVRLSGIARPDISHVLELLGIDDSARVFPDGLTHLISSINSSEIELVFNVNDGVSFCGVAVNLALEGVSWTVWEDHIAVKDISLHISVDFSGDENTYGVFGTVELHGTAFKVSAFSHSDFAVRIVMNDGAAISLSDYLHELCPYFKIPENVKLSIDKFEITALFGNFYHAALLLNSSPESAWVIPFGSKKAAITDLFLRIRYEQADDKFSGFYGGSVKFSDTVTVKVFAHSVDDFTLCGEVGVEENADIWDLFSDYSIPHWLRAAKLRRLKIEYSEETVITLECDIIINSCTLSAAVSLKFGKTLDISGKITVDSREFELKYAAEKETSLIYAVMDGEKQPIEINPALLGLKGDLSVSVMRAYLIMLSGKSDSVTSFGVKLGAELDFVSLPIVGGLINDGNLKIQDITVSYNTAVFTKSQQEFLTTHASACKITSFDEGVSAGGVFVAPNITPIPLNPSSESDTAANALTASKQSQQTKIKWISIKKDFGAVSLSRLGIGIEESRLTVLPDASLALGSFKCALIGAGISSPISGFNPKFELDGIAMAFKSPTVSVGGLIAKGSKVGMKYYYSGGVSVQLGKYVLAAAASMGRTDNGMFMFSILIKAHVLIVVAPSVTITDFSAAFGYNESIRMPKVEQVRNFPLVDETAATLDTWKEPSAGDYWGAAGLKFNVGKLLNGVLVLLAKFGHELEFDIIGNADITLPMGATVDEAYLYADIDILASLKPREGAFALTALLTDKSFLLSKQCRLTGGLAFNMWFGDNPHSGDFVFTLGGYHPSFNPPAHYPTVPRLGILWNISKELSVKGEAYLALTPSCIMAGGRLDAVYQSGIVRAWFIASADFLMTFHPFSFDAQLMINVGASVRIKVWKITITLSLSAGADLHLYGPPTGGSATIHLSVLTFTVSFGAAKADFEDKPLKPDDFIKLLPDKLHGISVSEGLAGQSGDTDTEGSVDIQVFGAVFYISTAIPAGKINIRPMNINSMESVVAVAVISDGKTVYDSGKSSEWKLIPVTGNVPMALWGEPLTDGKKFTLTPRLPCADVVPNMTVGYTLEPPEPSLGEKAEFEESGVRLSLRSFLIPPLRAGEYMLTTAQNAAGIEASAKLQFSVKSRGETASRYPAINEIGEFGKTLPHVIFSCPAYAFEKSAEGAKSGNEPWIALVTLSDEEFTSATVSDGVITFDGAFIRDILPTHSELPYFAHVRDDDENGMVGTVFSCRFPLGDSVNHACLLALNDIDVENIPDGNASFTLLDSWRFYDTGTVTSGFSSDVNGLDKNRIAEKILLRKDSADVSYHGLLTPTASVFKKHDTPKFNTSSSALVKSSDITDVSFACAFENARLTLLADSNALGLLFSIRTQIAEIAMRKENSPLITANDFFGGLLSQFMTAAERTIKLSELETDLPNSAADTSVRIGTDLELPADEHGNPTNELVTFAEAVYSIALQTNHAAAALFPNGSIIPNESIRFFNIDKNVVSAAVDGIFSVGLESEHDRQINNLLYKYVSDHIFAKLDGELTGFVINSNILVKWAGMEVYAFDKKGEVLEMFELRELGSSLRLYVYNGVIDNVIVREPAHTLCSGLTPDGDIMVKANNKISLVKLTWDCVKSDGRTISATKAAALTKAGNPARFGLDWLRIPEQVSVEVPR